MLPLLALAWRVLRLQFHCEGPHRERMCASLGFLRGWMGGSHTIQVFESSALNKEVGAAIIVPPNAKRILERFGCFEKNLRAVDYEGVSQSPQFARA
jgi:hypothetical protein